MMEGIGRDRHSLIGQKYWNLSRYHCANHPEIFLSGKGFEPWRTSEARSASERGRAMSERTAYPP